MLPEISSKCQRHDLKIKWDWLSHTIKLSQCSKNFHVHIQLVTSPGFKNRTKQSPKQISRRPLQPFRTVVLKQTLLCHNYLNFDKAGHFHMENDHLKSLAIPDSKQKLLRRKEGRKFHYGTFALNLFLYEPDTFYPDCLKFGRCSQFYSTIPENCKRQLHSNPTLHHHCIVMVGCLH